MNRGLALGIHSHNLFNQVATRTETLPRILIGIGDVDVDRATSIRLAIILGIALPAVNWGAITIACT